MTTPYRIFVAIRNKRVFRGREIYTLLQNFLHPDITLLLSERDSGKLREYGGLVRELDNVMTVPDAMPDTGDLILLTDDKPIPGNWQKVLQLRYDSFFNDEANETNALNFCEHPLLKNSTDRCEVQKLRSRKREIGVLFTPGNLDPVIYSSPILKRAFGVMNRSDLYAAVQRYPGVVNRDLGDQTEDASHSLVINTQSVQQSEWLRTIASSNFFIAPSGVVMPMCHNIIEAMSVGTIPITQYSHLFWPRLVHGETCIEFSDERDLERQIESVLRMDPDVVEAMRERVVAYYEQNLRPGANTERICRLIGSSRKTETLFFIAGSAVLRSLGWRTPLRWRADLAVHSLKRRLNQATRSSSEY